MLAAAPLAAWPTGKRGQADQCRSSAAAQPASVIKMALVCLPLLLLCSTVVAPPAAMVVPWAKPSLQESMEAESRRRFIEMNGLTRPDNASSYDRAQASVVGNAIWRPRLVAPVTNAVVGPQMRELAGESATGARSSILGKRETGDSSAGDGAVAKRAKTGSDAFKFQACGTVCQGARGMSIHLSRSHTCDNSGLGFEEYDPSAAHAASLREGAAEASCPWQLFKPYSPPPSLRKPCPSLRSSVRRRCH